MIKGKKLLEQPDVIDKMRIKSVDSEELILTEVPCLLRRQRKVKIGKHFS